MPKFLCQVDSSNKFWSYEIRGNSVYVKWGRMGGSSQDQTQAFGSSYERDKFIDSKVKEKTRKGYRQVDDKELKKEEKVANLLGHTHKISKMEWVDLRNDRLKIIKEYDSRKYVFVEILNSWSKDTAYLLLSKEEQFTLYGPEIGKTEITFSRKDNWAPGDFVAGIREALRGLAAQVAEVLVKFGAVGVRNLTGETTASTVDLSSIRKSVGSGVSDDILVKFAALGARKLEI